jgi:Colicin D
MKEMSRMSPPHAGHWRGNFSPTRAISLAQAIRDVSWERGFCFASQQPSEPRPSPPCPGLPDQLPATRPDGTLDPVFSNTVEEAGSPAARTGKALEGLELIPPKGLQKIFNKHGEDLGLDGDWNKSRGLEVLRALREHLSGTETTVILGRYRGEKVVHFLDPSTGVNVVTSQDGKFIGVWTLNDEQLESVRKNGRLF